MALIDKDLYQKIYSNSTMHLYILYLKALKAYSLKSSMICLNLYTLLIDTNDPSQRIFDYQIRMWEPQMLP